MDITTRFGRVILGSSPGRRTYAKSPFMGLFAYVHRARKLLCVRTGLEKLLHVSTIPNAEMQMLGQVTLMYVVN